MESEHVTGKEMEYDRKDAHGCMLHVFYCRGSLKNRVCRSRFKFEVRKIYVSHPGANEGKKTFPPKLILCSEYLTGTGVYPSYIILLKVLCQEVPRIEEVDLYWW
jgi:hypothetical protein